MKIVMGLDPGASLSKVIAEVEGISEPYLVMMSPEIAEVSRETLETYRSSKGSLGSPRPEDEAWLEWEGKIYLVGSLARDYFGDAGLKDLKYERAIYKAAAAVGAIAQIAGQTVGSAVNLILDLVVLLPIAEYEDRERFRVRLEKVLVNYSFRGQRLKVKLNRFLCRPEGSGLAMIRIRQKGLEWFRDRNLAVLMLGHRNVTVLRFSSGRLVDGSSPELGFAYLENQVIQRTSGQKPLELSRAIFRAHYAVATRSSALPTLKLEELGIVQSLARSRDEELRHKEISEIVGAIARSRAEYWQKLSRWLDSCLPLELDEVIISGGSGIYFKSDLENYFGRISKSRAQIPVCWAVDINEQVQAAFSFLKATRYQEEALAFRFIDVFGLFGYFKGWEAEAK